VLLLAGVALVACGDDDDDAAVATDDDVAVDEGAAGDDDDAGSDPVTDPGGGVQCADFPIAPAISIDELYGEWFYKTSHLYEDGEDYRADVRGRLLLTEDGRWDGERAIVTGGGSGNYPTSYGPGDWTFDGRTLTLGYDDGSDAETHTGVRVSDQIDEEGQAIRALSLESADGASCTVYMLYGQRRDA
jgi:hypothetical protein